MALLISALVKKELLFDMIKACECALVMATFGLFLASRDYSW